MTRDELIDLQRRFLREHGLPARSGMDVGELPDGDWISWLTWTYAAPLPTTGTDAEMALALETWDREVDRRQRLVEHAQSLRRLPAAEAKAAAAADAMATLPGRHDRERTMLQSQSEAAAAMTAIYRLPAKTRSKAAVFKLWCPASCELAFVYERMPHVLEPGPKSLLAVVVDARRTRRAAWLAGAIGQDLSPASVPIGCRHGHGTLATAFPSYVDRRRPTSRRVGEVEAVSWSAAQR